MQDPKTMTPSQISAELDAIGKQYPEGDYPPKVAARHFRLHQERAKIWHQGDTLNNPRATSERKYQ